MDCSMFVLLVQHDTVTRCVNRPTVISLNAKGVGPVVVTITYDEKWIIENMKKHAFLTGTCS